MQESPFLWRHTHLTILNLKPRLALCPTPVPSVSSLCSAMEGPTHVSWMVGCSTKAAPAGANLEFSLGISSPGIPAHPVPSFRESLTSSSRDPVAGAFPACHGQPPAALIYSPASPWLALGLPMFPSCPLKAFWDAISLPC